MEALIQTDGQVTCTWAGIGSPLPGPQRLPHGCEGAALLEKDGAPAGVAVSPGTGDEEHALFGLWLCSRGLEKVGAVEG